MGNRHIAEYKIFHIAAEKAHLADRIKIRQHIRHPGLSPFLHGN